MLTLEFQLNAARLRRLYDHDPAVGLFAEMPVEASKRAADFRPCVGKRGSREQTKHESGARQQERPRARDASDPYGRLHCGSRSVGEFLEDYRRLSRASLHAHRDQD